MRPDTATVQIERQEFNEYNYITGLKNSSPTELSNLGLTEQEADLIVAEFEDALMTRALLPEDKLIAYGYSEEEIEILRSYAAGNDLSDSELQSITATCSTAIVNMGVTANRAEFGYEWIWDQCPLVTLKDSAALCWNAYDENNAANDVERYSVDAEIYYWNTDQNYSFMMEGEEEEGLPFNAVNIQFPLEYNHVGSGAISYDCYAKSGKVYVTVVLPSGVTREIHHLFVSGLYGHTTVGLVFPSAGISQTGDLSISFSGNLSTESIGGKKATLSGYNVSYWG